MTGAIGHYGQFPSEDDQRQLLPARNAGRSTLFPLEHTQLLPQQDLNILVVVGSTPQPDEVEQQ